MISRSMKLILLHVLNLLGIISIMYFSYHKNILLTWISAVITVMANFMAIREGKMEKLKLSSKYSIDLSKPYCLMDNINDWAFACPHRSNGFCDECWNKFIDAGIKAIQEEYSVWRRKKG